MPGAVANASPVGTLPVLPIYAYSETREYLGLENRYQGGESERASRADTSRRVWTLTWRLTSDQLATLKYFYDSHGLTVPFHYTTLNDTTLYAAKFNTPWNQTTAWAHRTEVTLDLIQVT